MGPRPTRELKVKQFTGPKDPFEGGSYYERELYWHPMTKEFRFYSDHRLARRDGFVRKVFRLEKDARQAISEANGHRFGSIRIFDQKSGNILF